MSKSLQDYVVSRELAEELKRAGYPQETTHMWCKYSLGGWVLLVSDIGKDFNIGVLSGERLETVAAPLSDEILEQLPKSLVIGTYDRAPRVVAQYRKGETTGYGRSDTLKPADALARLWLWCKAKGHIE